MNNLSMAGELNLIAMFLVVLVVFNSLRPRQNGRHFSDGTFKRFFLNENVRISVEISLKFVPKFPINDITALIQVMVGN